MLLHFRHFPNDNFLTFDYMRIYFYLQVGCLGPHGFIRPLQMLWRSLGRTVKSWKILVLFFLQRDVSIKLWKWLCLRMYRDNLPDMLCGKTFSWKLLCRGLFFNKVEGYSFLYYTCERFHVNVWWFEIIIHVKHPEVYVVNVI